MELIDIEKLDNSRLLHKKYFPEISAIYFVFTGDELIYIGRAINLRKRFAEHEKFKGLNIEKLHVYWLPTEDLDIECFYIKKFRPLLNKIPPGIVVTMTAKDEYKEIILQSKPLRSQNAIKNWIFDHLNLDYKNIITYEIDFF